MEKKVIPVILCGGVGSRLFPLSRNNYPKQFIRLINKRSLLQNTILRFKNENEIMLIANSEHKHLILNQLNELFNDKLLTDAQKITVILEPLGRNTAPALNIACILKPNNRLIFVPSDHIFNDNDFIETIKIIKENFYDKPVITMGIKPTYPETGYGYILYDNDRQESTQIGGSVIKFIEKPKREIAEELFKLKNCYWNSGVYIFHSDIALQLFNKHMSKNHNHLLSLSTTNSLYGNIEFIALDASYNKCENVSVDYGLIEKIDAGTIYMIPFNSLWNDVGSYQAIHSITEKDSHGINKNVDIISNTSENCLVMAEKLVLLNNVSNLAIIDTPDVLMITDLAACQNVKNVYDLAKDKPQIRTTSIDYQEWGWLKLLSNNEDQTTVSINLYTKKSLTLNKSSVISKIYLIIISGSGTIESEEGLQKINPGDMICLDINNIDYKIINDCETELNFMKTVVYFN